MNLNRIKLSPFLLTELYRQTLVEAPPAPAKAQPISAPAASLGKNRRQILVVVENDCPVIPDEELSFLTNLLAACKLELDDVKVINWKHWAAEGQQNVISRFAGKIIFLFGVDPLRFGLPVNFPEFQVQALSKRTFLFSPALGQVANDKLLKSKLWLALKRIFSI
ncbi:MAG TPA: hypothetical protein VEB63_09925 [Chitinophagaceae bacterium]|nr:hypothetical protein [Chitinophagaceae bacterium]